MIVRGGVRLETLRSGNGETLLLLHDIEYVNEPRPFLEMLAKNFEVVSPSHPGFGGSDLPAGFDDVGDLAYLYLDLLADIGPAHVLGMGFGGWIAAEMAVRCEHGLRSLVLSDPVGIKAADRETAEIADTFVMAPETFLDRTWHDAELGRKHMKLPGLGLFSEAELMTLLRNREAAALFGWNPFMHNPKLLGRLHRINVPTLIVWGDSDAVVSTEYGKAFVSAIEGARLEVVEQAGHYPYLEQPERFTQIVTSFLQHV
jgi:pimeloyl-ACP methyl ester carboxylesterase